MVRIKRAWLYAQYWKKERMPGEIATELGCHRTTVLRWIWRYDIPRRTLRYQIRIAWGRDGWVPRAQVGRGRDLKRSPMMLGWRE